jgi:hypothetical protein
MILGGGLMSWFIYPKILATGAAVHGTIIAAVADSSSTDTNSSLLQTSLIAGAALVLAAAVPNLLALFRKEQVIPESQTVRDLREAQAKIVHDLEQDRDEWKSTAEAAIRGTAVRDHEIDRLRRMVIDRGGNPFPAVVTEDEVHDR